MELDVLAKAAIRAHQHEAARALTKLSEILMLSSVDAHWFIESARQHQHSRELGQTSSGLPSNQQR
jgi:hypothetical protein